MERAYTWCDGKRLEVTAKTLIMGILNVTPDSFSDGGRWNTAEKAQSHTREMTDAGADIIDVGAESTRPGGQPLTAEEEIERMKIFLPVVLGESRVPVSVDTYHWKTADYALHAGAHMMNDIWGLQYDHGEMAEVAGCHQVPVIVMHNKADTNYNGDVIEEMKTHIFEMFYTGKTTVADSHRSLGLGLALCHSIIEAHEGTLVLTDHDPHGCNFTFTLPLSEVTLNE